MVDARRQTVEAAEIHRHDSSLPCDATIPVHRPFLPDREDPVQVDLIAVARHSGFPQFQSDAYIASAAVIGGLGVAVAPPP